jgi:hypothetical protein
VPNSPLINATAKITAKDVNGNNVAKQFNAVRFINIDYTDGTINIIDATGSFYFPMSPLTTLTYTITPGFSGLHVLVAS